MSKSNEKIKVTNLDIIVTMIEDKPYFEIKYKEVGKEDYGIGYSSYDLNNVLGWKEEFFELIEPQNKESDETISVAECRKLREVIHMLTMGCYLKKSEFIRLMVVIKGILDRMEKEDARK